MQIHHLAVLNRMKSGYAIKFWKKMKILMFAFGPKQVIAAPAMAVIVAIQVHSGISKNGVARFLIISVPFWDC